MPYDIKLVFISIAVYVVVVHLGIDVVVEQSAEGGLGHKVARLPREIQVVQLKQSKLKFLILVCNYLPYD